MNYFKQKANEIKKNVNKGLFPVAHIVESDRSIEIGLKETARDMRHQLCDVILNELQINNLDSETVALVNRIIMNFEPKYKENKDELH